MMIRKIQSVLRLVRFPNLLIIAFTQYAMRYLIMEPLLPSSSFELQFGDFQFALLVFSTMLIAAAGYIINDYFDTQADLINKPKRVVVGVTIHRREAMILHAIMNIMGVGIGIYLAFYIKLPSLSMVFLIATGLLWFYSTNYKRQFLVGNLAVSILTGLVPLMVILFEIPLLNREYGEVMIRNNASFGYLVAWVSAFSFFAFITTLIREVIKDAEDFEGDRAYGMKTVPIVLGTFWTRIVLVLMIAGTLGALVYLLLKYIVFSVQPLDYISLIYFGLFLALPLIALAIQVLLARDKRAYRRASLLIKIVMLAGILYSVVVLYLAGFKY
ncbi:MAG: geranylgeranylglycerol-phosphate geranylgeranyltransferase [Bacteroidales bacterium]|nr:geranylgeranylglycerol-phosphate geranylgeranyltransferase [Bacteroidales bacterium]